LSGKLVVGRWIDNEKVGLSPRNDLFRLCRNHQVLAHGGTIRTALVLKAKNFTKGDKVLTHGR
jgi:hypothetical protein